MNEQTYFYQENPTKFYAHLIDTFLVQHYMRRISTFNRVKCFLKKGKSYDPFRNFMFYVLLFCRIIYRIHTGHRLCNLKPRV